jgi:uncharacterized protein (TIGR03083 family)
VHPAITALRRSHENLAALVAPLSPEQLRAQSYDSEWSIAQVLSHLASGAEIGALSLAAALEGAASPGADAMQEVWGRWDAKSPDEQAADVIPTDRALVEAWEAVDDARLPELRFALGPMELDGVAMSGLRLAEHAMHTWDVGVALDPSAVVAPEAVDILVDNLGMIAGFSAKPVGAPARIVVATTEPERRFVLVVEESVTLVPAADDDGPATITMPAEAFVRLVYGRLDPEHTPATSGDGVELDQLRAMFPGF